VSRSPFGWDLPPGCSHADIERAMGGDEPTKRCPECKGSGGKDEPCAMCDGDGEVPCDEDDAQAEAERAAEAAEDEADRKRDDEWFTKGHE